MMMSVRYIIVGLLGMLLYSCQGSPLLSGYSHVDREAWYREDTAVISMNGEWMDENVSPNGGTLMVGVRYTDAYRYKKISLLVELQDEEATIARDTVHFNLFDPNGHVVGRGLGYHDAMQPAIKLKALKGKGPYKVRITHLMRQNPVQGITEVSCFSTSAQHPSSEK